LVYQPITDQVFGIGPWHFIGGFNPLRIADTYFDMLYQVKPFEPNCPVAMHKGKRIPQIMCDWLTGTPPSIIRDQVFKKLTELRSSVDSKRKVKMVEAIARFTFTPESFAKAVKPLKEGVRTLKKVYGNENSDGQRRNRIIIITNWDAESFKLLYSNKKIRKILERADGIVVSGIAGIMKPDKRIFEHTFEQYGIDPDKELVISIDDRLENLDAIESLGKRYIKTIHCDGDFKKIRKTLRRWQVY
jgi:2-haloacid dehalogenase